MTDEHFLRHLFSSTLLEALGLKDDSGVIYELINYRFIIWTQPVRFYWLCQVLHQQRAWWLGQDDWWTSQCKIFRNYLLNLEIIFTKLSSDGGNVLHQGLNLWVHEVPWPWQRRLLLLFIWALRRGQPLELLVPQREASDPSRGDPRRRAHLPLLHQRLQPHTHGLGDRQSDEQPLGQLCHLWVSPPSIRNIYFVPTILFTGTPLPPSSRSQFRMTVGTQARSTLTPGHSGKMKPPYSTSRSTKYQR